MDLSDTIAARSAQPSLQPTQENDRGVAPKTSPESAMFSHASAAMDGLFAQVYGENGPEARSAVASAVAAEGPSAYGRLKAEPEAFGTVTGERSQAARLGGALEALDYSAAVYAAQQAGHAPAVPGFGARSARTEETAVGDGASARNPELGRGDVERAVATIREQLRDTPVGQDNLDAARDALFALDGTKPVEAVRMLGEEDLNRWADELNDTAVLGGYDGAARDAFYQGLVQRLDGEQLGRFGAAVAREAEPDTAEGRALGAAGAIAQQALLGIDYRGKQGTEGQRFALAVVAATPDVRADFVHETLPNVERDQDTAVMVAEVVGSLRSTPEHVRASLSRATDAELEALVSQGILRTLSASEPGPSGTSRASQVTYDATTTGRVLEAVAATSDVQLRARTFLAAASALRDADGLVDESGVGPGVTMTGPVPPGAILRASMQGLLDARAGDVVATLAQRDEPATALATYVRSNVATDAAGAIVRDIDGLLADGGDAQQAARFIESEPAPGGGTVYPNATRLGYYARALDAARDAQVEDIRTNGNVLSRLVGHIPNEWLKDVAEMGSERGVEALVERTAAMYADLIQHTIPPGININDGSEASEQFSRARGRDSPNGTAR